MSKRVSMLVRAGAFCLAAGIPLLGLAGQAQAKGGTFLVNTLSGKCVDVAGAPGASNGAPLQLFDCELSGRNADNGSDSDQTWEMTDRGYIRNTLSGKCMDVAGAPGTGNGARLQLYDCEFFGQNADNGSTTDQRWEMTDRGLIRNSLSGKCIDVAGAPGTANGAALQLYDCESAGTNADNRTSTDQRWRLQAARADDTPRGRARPIATCYWLQPGATGQWQPMPQFASKPQCYEQDSCDGGLGRSGGGCYKWAEAADAPRLPWNGER